MQEISDKLCAPITPPVAQRLIPEEKCEIEMKADVLLVLDGSFSTQVGFHNSFPVCQQNRKYILYHFGKDYENSIRNMGSI